MAKEINRTFICDHINDGYLQMIDAVAHCPEYKVSPRGQEIKEITNAHLILTNPKNCLLTLKNRKLNYKFATIEKFEYIAGSHNPSRLLKLNSNLKHFVNDYGFFDGHYSTRLHYWLPYIIGLLKKDPDSRQAVISIYGQQDRHASKDIPCTLTMQFLMRDKKLHMIVNMRSNDILWGVPYDTNSFCFILEVVAAALEVEMGTYSLNAGSLHLYTEREKQLTDLLKDTSTVDYRNPVLHYAPFEQVKDKLSAFLSLYDSNELNRMSSSEPLINHWLTLYATEFDL